MGWGVIMETLTSIKTICDDEFQVQFDVVPLVGLGEIIGERRQTITSGLLNVDNQLEIAKKKLDELNAEIKKLTNEADALDYAVAVISGVIAGMIDSFFVGETEIDKEKIEKILVKKYHTANDNAFSHKNVDGNRISSPLYHRLDDLAHHPTPLGLVASILARYFRLVIYIDGSDGKPHIFGADKPSNDVVWKTEKEQLIKAWVGAILGGICLWLVTMAENKYDEDNAEKMPEPLKKMVKAIGKAPLVIEILKSIDLWVGHMMSDVSTPQGIPGIFLSLLKEISVLPGLRSTNLPVFVDGLYNKGAHNLSEWGGVVFANAKKQSVPVLINEAIVRVFYFVRRLVIGYKNQGNFMDLDWNTVIPFANRTVERMITISSGTFVAMDLVDAAVRSATNATSVDPVTFFSNMLLRVNFVGVGRFAIAIVTDIGMGIRKTKKEQERSRVLDEMIHLTNVKVYYREADLMCSFAELYDNMSQVYSVESDMWKQVENTQESMDLLYAQIRDTGKLYVEAIEKMDECFDDITTLLPRVEEMNPGVLEEILRRLK